MRKFTFEKLLYILIVCMAVSCSKSVDKDIEDVIPTMTIVISDIDDNTVTINSTMLTGEAVSGKVVDFYPLSEIGIDYNTEVKLVQFVEDNGIDISLPYSKKVEQRLQPGITYMSAIIAYNNKGRAICSAYEIWQATGTEGLWSDDNTAGELEENNW